MAVEHTLNYNWNSQGDALDTKVTLTGEGARILSVSITDGTTDEQHPFTIDRSKAKTLYMRADQDLTVNINDAGTGSPAQTISLTANEPLVWTSKDPVQTLADIISADVTDFYVSNSSGNDATLEVRELHDN